MDCDGKQELDKSEEVSVDMEEFELLSSKRKLSALLQTLKNVIETSMQNPKRRCHHQQISLRIGNSALNQKTLKCALSELEPLENGRSRSNSCSAKSTKKYLMSYLLYIFICLLQYTCTMYIKQSVWQHLFRPFKIKLLSILLHIL